MLTTVYIIKYLFYMNSTLIYKNLTNLTQRSFVNFHPELSLDSTNSLPDSKEWGNINHSSQNSTGCKRVSVLYWLHLSSLWEYQFITLVFGRFRDWLNWNIFWVKMTTASKKWRISKVQPNNFPCYTGFHCLFPFMPFTFN